MALEIGFCTKEEGKDAGRDSGTTGVQAVGGFVGSQAGSPLL